MSTLFYSHSDCRLHDMGPGHPECPQRLDAISDHLLATGLDIALLHKDAPMATLDQLERAHAAGYVLQLKDLLEQIRDAGQCAVVRSLRICPHRTGDAGHRDRERW